MSSSGKNIAPNERLEIPVFLSPTELVFSPNKRRALLTIFNPYDNDAQFKVMTTSPERYEVSTTKGNIRAQRRVDITIRLLVTKLEDFPEPTEEPETIDHFKISLQYGNLRGNKPMKVLWCLNIAQDSSESIIGLMASDDRTKFKLKSRSASGILSSNQINQSTATSSPGSSCQKSVLSLASSSPTTRSQSGRQAHRLPNSQVDFASEGSNVNLFCTLGSLVCVIILYLPLYIDPELCTRAKCHEDPSQTVNQFGSMFSVGYEIKLGSSFALGLFLFRLISTLPS